MKIYEDRTFEGLYDDRSRRVFSDLEFRHCRFESCALSICSTPKQRSTVRNVHLVQCVHCGCSVKAAIIEDVLVDGLTTEGGLLQCFGAVFKHVTLKGRIDRLMISNKPLLRSWPRWREEMHVRAFLEANATYYNHVDWALDISRGEFKELDIRGLPGRLVRRDPETQVLVTREKVLEGRWRDLQFQDPLTPFSLGLLLDRGDDDKVVIADKLNKNFRNRVADIQLLRQAGIAEPD